MKHWINHNNKLIDNNKIKYKTCPVLFEYTNQKLFISRKKINLIDFLVLAKIFAKKMVPNK